MWPENTSKSEIYMLDTYFNKNSCHAAYLGVGAIQKSIDKIIKNEWNNAFCIIRPPGHHSGHMKVCTGFCFFNNVAIAARYLQK
jgi:histone deacetylase 6